MPFVSEPLDDVHEPTPAPEGEYDLRIVKAEQRESKKGLDMIQLTIVIEGEDAPPFNHFLLSWESDTDDDQIRMRKLEIRRFCAAFGIEENFEAEDLVGLTASGIYLWQEEGDDGVVRNRARWPKLKE